MLGERGRSDDTRLDATVWVHRRRYVYAIVALLVVASVVPVPAIGVAQPGGAGANAVSPTLVFHLIGYAALAVSLVRAQPVERRYVLVAAAAVGVAAGVGFGVELLQTVVPWRRFAWVDSAANALGACAGICFHATVRVSFDSVR